MKTIFLSAIFFTLSASFLAASVSFTGNFASNLRNAANSGNVAIGTRYIMIVDTGGNGFGSSTQGGAAAGSLAVGQLFGGDEIVASGTTVLTSGRAPATALTGFDLEVSPYSNKQFAIVWFDGVTGTTASNANSYGFFRDAGWITPTSALTLGFAASGSDYVQSTAPGFASLSIAAAPIPEPSRMMLLGFGLLGVFFRRRR